MRLAKKGKRKEGNGKKVESMKRIIDVIKRKEFDNCNCSLAIILGNEKHEERSI